MEIQYLFNSGYDDDHQRVSIESTIKNTGL